MCTVFTRRGGENPISIDIINETYYFTFVFITSSEGPSSEMSDYVLNSTRVNERCHRFSLVKFTSSSVVERRESFLL